MLVPSNIDAKFQALLKCDIPSKRAGLSALRPRKSPTRFHEDPDKESLDYGYQYPDSILAIISSLRFDCFASSPNLDAARLVTFSARQKQRQYAVSVLCV